MPSRSENAGRGILESLGVNVGGSKPQDIKVHDQRFYDRVLSGGSLAMGESYMDGWWDANQLDAFFTTILSNKDFREQAKKYWPAVLNAYAGKFLNRQGTQRQSIESVHKHYDIGNDLYVAMLDKRMAYTCGYWKDATNVDEAQEAKFDLVCRKIGLEKGMTVLDLGCGWGCFAKFAAEKYGAKVLGVTVSKEQVALGTEMCQGLPVEIRLQDYRDSAGSYDRVVSIGLMEHVGPKNYETLMKTIHRTLKDGGLGLVHTIGGNYSTTSIDPWIDKYIFPNAVLPSISQISKAMENLFVVEDWHNFGADYDKTLMAWHENISAKWSELDPNKYDERFRRMWDYYLLMCAGGFRSRMNQLWQVVISKEGVPGGYTTVR
ncbi:MAG: cyclopropane fatty acyl phospholipid synthase [Patescibacteria group bacterium]